MSVRVDADEIRLPRPAVRFPIELRVPDAFDPNDPATYPAVEGRLEYVSGRLWYMPPTGDIQQDVAPDVIHVLRSWSDANPEFIIAGNEAGMILGGEVRGADVAVWRRADVPPRSGRFRRVPPVLAVEIAGVDDDEASLRGKAKWYLEHGVQVVWLVFPDERSVLVLAPSSEAAFSSGQTIGAHPALPGLSAAVDALFAQLDA